VAVHDATSALSNGDAGSDMDSFEERYPTGVVCELADWPLVHLPAHPVREPEFFRCFLGVWNALTQSTSASFVGPFDPVLTYQTGLMGESLHDAVLTAHWKAGRPTLTQQVRESLESEYGIDADNIAEPLAIYRTWLRATRAKPIAPHTSAFTQFLRLRATKEQAALLNRCVTLLERLDAHGHKRARGEWRYSTSGDGTFEMFLMPRDFGVDDYLEEWINSMYDSGETPRLHIAPLSDDPNPTQLFELADRVIVEAIIATAIHCEIVTYAKAKQNSQSAASTYAR